MAALTAQTQEGLEKVIRMSYVDICHTSNFAVCRNSFYHFLLLIFEAGTISHCSYLDLNDIRPGIASDGNFSSYLIGRS